MQQGGKPVPGMPEGMSDLRGRGRDDREGRPSRRRLPSDVAAPPATAKKTEKGVAYKVLKAGKGGPKPAVDRRRARALHAAGPPMVGMFDSSVIKGQPAEFSLGGVIAGWTDGIPVMSVGDRVRFWIPEELAYKGAPGKPQGMLVFDVELLEIKAPAAPDAHGDDDGHGHGKPADAKAPPAPPDVAAPPKDAKKTEQGVFYKILTAGQGRRPAEADRHREGALHGLDHRRQAVRLVDHARAADRVLAAAA